MKLNFSDYIPILFGGITFPDFILRNENKVFFRCYVFTINWDDFKIVVINSPNMNCKMNIQGMFDKFPSNIRDLAQHIKNMREIISNNLYYFTVINKIILYRDLLQDIGMLIKLSLINIYLEATMTDLVLLLW